MPMNERSPALERGWVNVWALCPDPTPKRNQAAQGWPRPFRLIGRPAGRASAALDAMRFRPPRLIAMVLADTGHVMPSAVSKRF
jgi:hypothetical protein